MVIMYSSDGIRYIIDMYNMHAISIIILWFSLSILLSYFLYKIIEVPVVNMVREIIKKQSKKHSRGNRFYERDKL
ncbi:hypothetical protein XNC1_0733 [Xenorhabdus nematophila ATCC 19061]|uniref:Uncharacterized protein n=1 Tax=Xenorhabdus nematophila (strain ATCC 19061 / DSM 3370 / CCUG 14189 / LMG 1036 / NCIMB 9965 / AN6) TaxID=406817 RepID=D3VJP8_XENNA|nr:hypothetical protein XNC1_0733 [Xenorhabdus nematophila ATCC 19061]